MVYKTIDAKALRVAKEFRKSEADLLNIIIEVDRHKVFRRFGYNSLYQYVHRRLDISESQTYAFICVARKSHEVPKLQQSIKRGELSINKAKRITSVINNGNQDKWIEMAVKKSQKMLEREVALAHPEKAILEKAVYISSGEPLIENIQIKKHAPRVKLEVGLSEKNMLKLRRAQDLVSQKIKRAASLEQTIETLLNDYIKREDPVEKAKRQKMKGKLNALSYTIEKDDEVEEKDLKNKKQDLSARKNVFKPKSSSEGHDSQSSAQLLRPQDTSLKTKPFSRKGLPAKIKHQVFLRDQGQCTAITPEGNRCSSKRFLEVHHIQPVSEGGQDNLENLTLLCSGHHSAVHMKSSY